MVNVGDWGTLITAVGAIVLGVANMVANSKRRKMAVQAKQASDLAAAKTREVDQVLSGFDRLVASLQNEVEHVKDDLAECLGAKETYREELDGMKRRLLSMERAAIAHERATKNRKPKPRQAPKSRRKK